MEGKSEDRLAVPEEDPESNMTKMKINTLISQFGNFEDEMKDATRMRREKDDYELEKLAEEMAVLERELSAEQIRRSEMNTSLQVWMEEELAKLKEKVTIEMHLRMDKLQDNIDKVNDRIGLLEEDLEREKVEIPADIERRGEELTQRLEEFQALFESERLDRLEREKEITRRIANHENFVDGELEKESTIREKALMEIKQVLDSNVSYQKNRCDRFVNVVEDEISKLKNAITKESIVREKEDDEIVETLARYTSRLQASLRVINATEEDEEE